MSNEFLYFTCLQAQGFSEGLPERTAHGTSK